MATPTEFISALRKHVGIRYAWGGKTPATGFDCSGLIHFALDQIGVAFVHGSKAQIEACQPITVDEALQTPGALLWFEGHDAISLGDGKTLEAVTKPNNGVGSYAHGNRFTKAGLIPGIEYPKAGNTVSTMISPVAGRVSSEWSKNRKHPVTGRVTSHAGIDIAAPIGSDVVAAFGGTVVSVRTGSYRGDKTLWKGAKSGNHVLIKNADGAYQYYGHLSQVDVREGDKVAQGQKIGEVGDTGNVTGPHLHFETWSNGNMNSHFNPRILFQRYSLTPGSAPAKSNIKPVASKPKPKPTGKTYTTVKRGSKNSTVGKVQQALRNEGYTKQIVDNVFGAQTQANVKDYQRRTGLVQDGIAGSITQKRLGL